MVALDCHLGQRLNAYLAGTQTGGDGFKGSAG